MVKFLTIFFKKYGEKTINKESPFSKWENSPMGKIPFMEWENSPTGENAHLLYGRILPRG
ncbi:hypothetical protein ACF0H5_005961 [Mactra antiquata]